MPCNCIKVSDMLVFGLIVIFQPLSNAVQQDTLIGFNCQNPADSKFFDHGQCRKHSDSFSSEEFTILQKRSVRKISGFECTGHETIEVGYCGRYSHNKMTDQSSFGNPMKIHKEDCADMVDRKVFSNGFHTFPL